MTVEQWLHTAVQRLCAAGDMDAKFDAECMLMDVLDVDRARLRLRHAASLDDHALDKLESWLLRRVSGEPLQYIEGFAYFMGLQFFVDERVLIPRQDTETLCELALKELKSFTAPEVLDLCTGSGALAVSIAALCPNARVSAADLSRDALEVARLNAERLSAKVEFFQGDMFSAVSDKKFDVIVCNPPYLTEEDMQTLQREVRHEPSMALDGGNDGLNFYRRIADALPEALNAGGRALLEVGHTQAAQVAELLLHSMPHAQVYKEKDLCGVERVVVLRKESAGLRQGRCP